MLVACKRPKQRGFVSVLQPGELIIYYELEESERSSTRGIVEVCPDTHR